MCCANISNFICNSMSESKRLRILTYMCPELPVDIFTLLRDCIEEVTGLETDLLVENRFPGPQPNRTDPFVGNLADIIIVHSSDYLRLKANNHPNMELCPAAPVHAHPLHEDKPVYYSEVIIHAANKEKYKGIQDLKGCSWAYNESSSLSGNLVVLHYLKNTLKTNATFLGAIVESGSHLNSIKMVKDYRVEAAAVDSNVLAGYLREHEEDRDKLVSLISLGPLPVYPILFNSRLSGDLKKKITDSFLALNKSPKWSERLNAVGIVRFASVDSSLYNLEVDLQNGVKGMSINTTYY